ncbi:hypothetical protein [Leptothrix ochracea]|uniref:hypothetical protein n=1 Tax=Leptothrix ochracea TaxID=735331 RepID=UPI0034E2E913
MQPSRLEFCRPGRRFWTWVLLGALLTVQALGFWHRVVHADHPGAPTGWSQTATPTPNPFDDHHEDGSDCRLFDALTTAALGVWTIPVLFGLLRLGFHPPQGFSRVKRFGAPSYHAQARAPPRPFHAR